MGICTLWKEITTGREDCVDSTQNIISFCTGYGGIELGIRRAGVDVRTIVNVEIEAFCCANMAAKIEEGRMDNAPIWTDLKTFPAREFRGKVHGLIGGYPCQPFSSAGKRQGEKDPRHLWPYILKHIRAIGDVQWCFFENVAGHTTMGLWRVLSDLEEEGYRVETGIFSAEEVGAPHQRKRVFILAYRECEGSQRWIYGGQNKERESVDGYSRCGGTSAHGRRDSEQLGNSTSKRPHRGSENCEGEQSEVLRERLESDEELGNASKHGRGSHQSSEEAKRVERQSKEGRLSELEGGCKQSQDEWPARPGEEQYEWEEPRVTEAQSFMGGATHGTTGGVDPIANRVDRLRLLGNGVVPQTAELAWVTLWKEMNK